MPELPEVEIARRNLMRWFKGRKVLSAKAPPSRIFRGARRATFEKIRGKLSRIDRRGKYLLLSFEQGIGLLVHLGMTGKLVRRTEEVEPYSKARWILDDGKVIHFKDPRMFGRIEPVPSDRLLQLGPIAALGIDPVSPSFDASALKGAIQSSKQGIKVALMDQSRVAGLGNLHAAEALYRAKIHPARSPQSLSEREWKALAKSIRETIRFAIAAQADEEIDYVEEPGSPNPFFVYGRKGEKCKRCGRKVASFTQGGRTTFYCPGCQRK